MSSAEFWTSGEGNTLKIECEDKGENHLSHFLHIVLLKRSWTVTMPDLNMQTLKSVLHLTQYVNLATYANSLNQSTSLKKVKFVFVSFVCPYSIICFKLNNSEKNLIPMIL